MNPFEMVVIIVAITAIAGVLKARYGHHRARDDEDEGIATGGSADAARLRDEVRTLKERIAVLERIATDRTTSLDHEIERLRER